MTGAATPARLNRAQFVTGAGLALLSAVVAIDHVKLSRVRTVAAAATPGSEMTKFQEQVTDVKRQLTVLADAPQGVTQAAFDAARRELEHHVSQVERQMKETFAHASDLAALQIQVDGLESRLAKARRPATAPSPRPLVVPAKPVALEPPFTPLGVELRGGERFLSLVPAGTHSLRDVRVIRPGDSEGDWILERLEGQVAVFRIGGQLQRIVVP